MDGSIGDAHRGIGVQWGPLNLHVSTFLELRPLFNFFTLHTQVCIYNISLNSNVFRMHSVCFMPTGDDRDHRRVGNVQSRNSEKWKGGVLGHAIRKGI